MSHNIKLFCFKPSETKILLSKVLSHITLSHTWSPPQLSRVFRRYEGQLGLPYVILKIFPLEFLRGLNWHPWLLKPFILKKGTKSKIASFLRTVLLVNSKKSSLGMQTGFRPCVHSVLEPWWLLCCFSEIQHTSASEQTYASASLYNSSNPWRQQKFHFSVKRCLFTASACSRRDSIYTFCITRSLCGCLSTTHAAGF